MIIDEPIIRENGKATVMANSWISAEDIQKLLNARPGDVITLNQPNHKPFIEWLTLPAREWYQPIEDEL